MNRRPRSAKERILPRGRMINVIVMGLVMAIGTLGAIYFAEGASDVAKARTVGVVTFSLFNVLFALEALDERVSVFSAQILRNPTLIKTTLLSLATIIAGTELRFFQSFLDTTSLSLRQWAICFAVALSVVVVAEAWKFVLRRRPERPAVAVPTAGETVSKRPTRPVVTSG